VEQLELNDKQRLADDDTIKDVQQSSANILIRSGKATIKTNDKDKYTHAHRHFWNITTITKDIKKIKKEIIK